MALDPILSRAQGCLLGQCCGDALGSAAEFQEVEDVRRKQPEWPREIVPSYSYRPAIGGPTVAGQPTDDSEMALALARALVARGTFDITVVREAYLAWLASGPFDFGFTIQNGLMGNYDPASEANGALMRVSPLGIFGARHDPLDVAHWAHEDAAITHINPICGDASALYAVAISEAIREGLQPREVHARMVQRAKETGVDKSLLFAVTQAAIEPPRDFTTHAGHVLVALQNALFRMLYAESPEQGMIETVLQGGDTDTNAAICGALMGAVHGRDGIPQQWHETILNCRLEEEPAVFKPRPRAYWPIDVLELAAALLGV